MIQINKPPHQRILELGGGENPNPASDVRVDIRPIEGKVDWVQDFENEPLRCQSGEFDCVYSHFCLEHVSYTKLPALLKEIHRVLKPNGKVLIAVPNTLKQIEWLLSHPEGWDGKDFFTASSELLFGSQTYDANAHKCFFTPEALAKLFREAGFEHIRTTAYGDRSTDMVLDAVKLASTIPVSPTAPVSPAPPPSATEDSVTKATESLNALMQEAPVTPPATPPASTTPTNITSLTREEMFDKHYFNGGGKVGGYAREGYWDYPVHNITAQHVRVRRPKSVLEIGCGRGYILKRLQDWGIPVCGLEISRHAWMTRAIDPILNIDICTERWPIEDNTFDMSFSMATFEHIPEQYIPHVLSELKRVCKSHLHGIDFGQHDDGFDKTHCFPAGTLVRMADGRDRPIEEVQIGDLLCGTKDNKTIVPTSVTRLYRRQADELVYLTLDTGGELIGTAEHPVMVNGRGWVQMGDLQPGDEVLYGESRKIADQRTGTVRSGQLQGHELQADRQSFGGVLGLAASHGREGTGSEEREVGIAVLGGEGVCEVSRCVSYNVERRTPEDVSRSLLVCHAAPCRSSGDRADCCCIDGGEFGPNEYDTDRGGIHCRAHRWRGVSLHSEDAGQHPISVSDLWFDDLQHRSEDDRIRSQDLWGDGYETTEGPQRSGTRVQGGFLRIEHSELPSVGDSAGSNPLYDYEKAPAEVVIRYLQLRASKRRNSPQGEEEFALHSEWRKLCPPKGSPEWEHRYST